MSLGRLIFHPNINEFLRLFRGLQHKMKEKNSRKLGGGGGVKSWLKHDAKPKFSSMVEGKHPLMGYGGGVGEEASIATPPLYLPSPTKPGSTYATDVNFIE